MEELKSEVAALIALYESKKKLCHEQQLQNKYINEQLKQSREQIEKLKKELEEYKLKAVFVGNPEIKAEAKKKLDSLIGVVDKCIKMVTKEFYQ